MKKKLFILLFAALGICTISSTTYSETHTTTVLECKYDQCHATAKSTGKRCKHCVSKKGDLYCWQHRD